MTGKNLAFFSMKRLLKGHQLEVMLLEVLEILSLSKSVRLKFYFWHLVFFLSSKKMSRLNLTTLWSLLTKHSPNKILLIRLSLVMNIRSKIFSPLVGSKIH